MAAAKAPVRDLAAEIAFLTQALKAPTLRESVPQLADRTRVETWSHEEFLLACSGRSPPARRTAARAAFAPPSSRPASAWRSST